MSDKVVDDIKSGKGISKDTPKPSSDNNSEQRTDIKGTRREQFSIDKPKNKEKK